MSTPLPPQADAVAVFLARHAVRRSAGVPTVSVLVGPVGSSVRAWRAWATGAGRPVTAGSAIGVDGVAELVARAVRGTRDLLADACTFLGAHTVRSAGELRAALAAMTGRDLADFFAANDGCLPRGPAARLSRELLERAVSGGSPRAENLIAADDPLRALAGLAGLVSAEALPAVLLTPPSSEGVGEWFRAAGSAVVEVAMRVPALAAAVAVSAAVWADYSEHAPEGRVKALLREGLVEVPVLDERGVEQLFRDAGVDPHAVPAAVKSVVAGGVPDEFARAAARVIAAPVAATTPQEDDEARSAAERFLFEFLEVLPDTAGRFELNAGVGFRFGPREAEVDLLARDFGVAIEIDGYYHFRDQDAYRRDRGKDWELQRRGFLVLRFLAGDIIPRLEDVRDRILAAVALRRAAEGNPA